MKHAMKVAALVTALLLSLGGTASAGTPGTVVDQPTPRGDWVCPPMPWYFCGHVANASKKTVKAIPSWGESARIKLRPGEMTNIFKDTDGVELPCKATGTLFTWGVPHSWTGKKGNNKISGYEKLIIRKVHC